MGGWLCDLSVWPLDKGSNTLKRSIFVNLPILLRKCCYQKEQLISATRKKKIKSRAVDKKK